MLLSLLLLDSYPYLLRCDRHPVFWLYLEACAEENNPTLMAQALGAIARARNMSQLARDTGLTREGLYKALSGDGNPSLATVMKVAHTLGLQITFRRTA